MKNIKNILFLLLIMFIAGCTTAAINISCKHVKLSKTASYGVIPFRNNTDRPQAGIRAATITAGILHTRGIANVKLYSLPSAKATLLANPNQTISLKRMFAWARRNNIQYLVTGSVNEWRYKVGLDGEPAVNVTIKIQNAKNMDYIWNAVGSYTGSSRDGLGVVAQKLITVLLANVELV